MKKWANLMPENGLDGGGQFGRKMSEAGRLAISKAQKGRKKPLHVVEAVKKANTGKKWTKEELARKPSMKGIAAPKLTCNRCGFTGGAGAMHRWHFDNCRK